MAHKVRLTANEELHGKPKDLDDFTELEAEESQPSFANTFTTFM
jgi:hypothetical protein